MPATPAMPTGADAIAAARRGEFTAVFPRGADARDFYERITGNAPSPYSGRVDPPGAWYVSDVKLNRKGGRIVTWQATAQALADEAGQPGWQTHWDGMCLTVGMYGSTFGEPPFGAGRRTAYLNGRACPAEM
jgi:hypothetical protein